MRPYRVVVTFALLTSVRPALAVNAVDEAKLQEALRHQHQRAIAMRDCPTRNPLKGGKSIEDGMFVAEVPMKRRPSGGERGRWFHDVVVKIENGAIKANEMPLVYDSEGRHQSVSEGGFYQFDGCLVIDGDHYTATLERTSFDDVEPGDPTKKIFRIKPSGHDLDIGGRLFRRTLEPERW
jgi:hypothetical protein